MCVSVKGMVLSAGTVSVCWFLDEETSPQLPSPCFSRELIRCLKWYMDRSAEVVRQDHIQEAMRVSRLSNRDHLRVLWLRVTVQYIFSIRKVKM